MELLKQQATQKPPWDHAALAALAARLPQLVVNPARAEAIYPGVLASALHL